MAVIPALLGLGIPAAAQGLVFPGARDVGAFGAGAFVDHGGVDWRCDAATSPGHAGTDYGVGGFLGMDAGLQVAAAAGGLVVAASDGELDRCETGDGPGGGGLGNYVVLQHPDGQHTVYAHLAQWSVAVAVGDAVVCGQVLGEVGSSGASTGPHLHFELRGADGAAVDPYEGPCGAAQSSWDDQLGDGEVPGGSCGGRPACVPSGALACGQRLLSDNDGVGATSDTWHYGCTDWVYSGPERSWTLTVPAAGQVAIALDELGADLDLYVVDEGGCDGTGCVAASVGPDGASEAVTFGAEADRTYLVVVDGWEGAVSDFALTVTCDVEAPPSPPPPPPDTAAPAVTDRPSPPGAPASAGCGCTSGSARWDPAVGLALAGLVGLARRRRAR